MASTKFSVSYIRPTLCKVSLCLFGLTLFGGLLPLVVAAQELEGIQLPPVLPGSVQSDLLTSSKFAQSSIETPNEGINSPEAQGNSSQSDSPVSPEELRQQLQIPPLLDPTSSYYPSSGTGIPEAFGSEWGDLFIAVTGASKDRVRTTFIDSAISMGFGLGNPRNLVGLELAYNILSTRTKFAANGSFDLKVHRYIFEDNNFAASAALGVSNFYSYGPEASFNPPVVYGVVSGFTYLRPDDAVQPMPLTVSLGAGGAPMFAETGVGLMAGAGVQVHPQIGLGSSWGYGGFNLGASFLPFRNIPLTLNALYTDIFNMTIPGHRLSITLDYSYRFK